MYRQNPVNRLQLYVFRDVKKLSGLVKTKTQKASEFVLFLLNSQPVIFADNYIKEELHGQ